MKRKASLICGALGILPLAARLYRKCIDIKRCCLRVVDRRSFAPRALILVYHRVANLASDPLLLAVGTRHFEEQLVMLKGSFDIISTAELVMRIRTKTLKGDEAVITFDDGYKDNLTQALPIAKSLGVPISIFVTTGIFENADNTNSPNGPLPFPWDGMYQNTRDAYLSESDLEALSKEPLVTLGAHTVNHPRLSDLGHEAQRAEILGSKEKLEGLLGKPVEYFAYPFGDYPDIDDSAARAVKESGYRAAFSNVQRLASGKSDIVRIPRILARDWSGEELRMRLNYFIPRRSTR